MKITLITVGKTDVPWVKEGLDLYISRLARYVPFSLVELPQLKNTSSLSQEQIKEKEGQALLLHIGAGDQVILLDEKGRELTSIQLSETLKEWTVRSSRNLVFVIGGAYGFSPAVYERAGSLLSLSRMTFSHQMVRVIFAEQLYRAFTILKGEPYHHP